MGKLAQMDNLLSRNEDWEVFKKQVKKLRDISPDKSSPYVGVCGCSHYYNALNEQTPNEVELTHVARWRERCAEKIRLIESGEDISKFRQHSRREKMTKQPSLTPEALAQSLFDAIMAELEPAFRDVLVRNVGLSNEQEEQLSLARKLVACYPSIDE